jgi:hypothetical protein
MSDKYLRSIYCMTELYEIWLRCMADEDIFRKRVHVFTLPDARISNVLLRSEYISWWQEEHAKIERLMREKGQDILSVSDYEEFRRMGHLVRHLPDILSLVQDVLRPRDFHELVEYGFRRTRLV